jgi:hypothetical protein
MVNGIKNSIKSMLISKIPKAAKANENEWPSVNKVTNHKTFFHCLKEKTTAKTIRNKMWSMAEKSNT